MTFERMAEIQKAVTEAYGDGLIGIDNNHLHLNNEKFKEIAKGHIKEIRVFDNAGLIGLAVNINGCEAITLI